MRGSYSVTVSTSECMSEGRGHTPSIAFPHLPPNSARIGYTSEGALFVSTQLCTNAVSALRKVCNKKQCGIQASV